MISEKHIKNIIIISHSIIVGILSMRKTQLVTVIFKLYQERSNLIITVKMEKNSFRILSMHHKDLAKSYYLLMKSIQLMP
jgi:hypothetical protein